MWLTQRGEEKGKLWGKRYSPPFCPLISQKEKHIKLADLISIVFKKSNLCNEYLPGERPVRHRQLFFLGTVWCRWCVFPPLPLSLSPSLCVMRGVKAASGEGHCSAPRCLARPCCRTPLGWATPQRGWCLPLAARGKRVSVMACRVLGVTFIPREASQRHHSFTSFHSTCPCYHGHAVSPAGCMAQGWSHSSMWSYDPTASAGGQKSQFPLVVLPRPPLQPSRRLLCMAEPYPTSCHSRHVGLALPPKRLLKHMAPGSGRSWKKDLSLGGKTDKSFPDKIEVNQINK